MILLNRDWFRNATLKLIGAGATASAIIEKSQQRNKASQGEQ